MRSSWRPPPVPESARREVWWRARGRCKVCGKMLPLDGPLGIRGEFAHRVVRSKHNVGKYGADAINHPDNAEWTCHEHNSSVIIGDGHPVERDRHMAQIRAKIEEGR